MAAVGHPTRRNGRILEHLGLPTDPPRPAAVGPPEQRFDGF